MCFIFEAHFYKLSILKRFVDSPENMISLELLNSNYITSSLSNDKNAYKCMYILNAFIMKMKKDHKY